MEDKILIAWALAQNQEGFTGLMNKYKDLVLSEINKFSASGGMDSAEPKDLMQIAFQKAFSSLDRYDPQYAFSTWLTRIVRNVCIDHKRRVRQVFQSLDGVKEISPVTPETGIIEAQEEDAYVACIHRLKPLYRQVVWLRYSEDLPYEEIANRLGITVGAVKVRMHRAKIQLARLLEEREA